MPHAGSTGGRAHRQAIRESHRVYYWSCTRRGGLVAFLLVGISTRHESMHELWVLVDEETGMAEGAVYRER